MAFFKAGISKVSYLKEQETHFNAWLDKSYHAGMEYLKNNKDKRFNPGKLLPNAKSIISVLLNYYPKQLQSNSENIPKISKYAYGRDYHKVMKKMLKSLAVYINTELCNINYRIFVDSAPVLDKTWAEKAGLGWIGKHSLLINKDIGSFIFIGEIIVDIELEYDTNTAKNYCGNCTACIDACPTNAIVDNKIVDANKCISYLTIEHKNEIPYKFKGKLENNIFGCDICQDVCPWNNKKIITNIDDFTPLPERLNLTFDDLNNMNETEFNRIFNGTPVKRAKFKGIKRNLKFLTDK